ncbi:conserved hypothetical protein (plasmid) [Trichormus variabilis ATCC 29413]|uniref:Tetratricopeptide repeat protein n=1 Tax=Trichormus variabilis (strain ATCC 29413 / PCC 7937) TaxID=240292 RepID=Q3M2R4_TRIV2|nr:MULTISPECIES: hypothetical protein [Nostocaceae]ABA24722.1 conserved hypothetical protein [Trichormus variabilis ATCC 29413]MBC1217993.1 hypothetical protein [Trichormus variabilis ARAD]MBC1259331.1 hypothetical protein [Trichormus variabilis V5]MBC1329757.1 hypothetical protein [Trichormus variabilis 9RC]MBD2382761.1 hypothetical protein [Trichormus variabilis FACHB-319]
MKIKNFNLFSLITLLTLFFSNHESWGQTILKQDSNHCTKPIGRIVEAGKGRLICQNEKITLENESLFICYSDPKMLKLQPGVYIIDSICKGTQASRKCTLLTTDVCPNRKGPNRRENAPNIIQPYGKMLINRRPLISWTAVPGATSYIVEVSGGGVKWQKQVVGTTLSYPQDQQELSYGSANKIIVIANKGDTPIIDATLVVHLLSEQSSQQINQAAETIQSLGLSADETAYIDLDAIYMSQRLLNETIKTLETRVVAGSFNPSLYRILGDRYVEAWMPQEAKTAYIKALQLARFQKNPGEVKLVQERLSALVQSQLPTRTNPAQ